MRHPLDNGIDTWRMARRDPVRLYSRAFVALLLPLVVTTQLPAQAPLDEPASASPIELAPTVDTAACDGFAADGAGPGRQFSVFYGYDAWRGVPDGAWTNNGIHVGLNFGTRLGRISDWTGLGLQIGGSIGVYDWAGTDYRVNNQDLPTTQGMLTAGFFRRASAESPWSYGAAQDWMINHNYSVMGEDSTLYQWRGQLGYVVTDWTELGVWGACRGEGDTRDVGSFGPVTWQPIHQLNAFWHHKWGYQQADTWIWVGVPEDDRLTGGGSLGDWIAGAYGICPLSDRLAVYNMVSYMHQSATPGPDAAKEEAWNFYLGITFVPGGCRSATVHGQRWAPLLPVANNGLFLVDASRTY
jgi:hypothetical protein